MILTQFNARIARLSLRFTAALTIGLVTSGAAKAVIGPIPPERLSDEDARAVTLAAVPAYSDQVVSVVIDRAGQGKATLRPAKTAFEGLCQRRSIIFRLKDPDHNMVNKVSMFRGRAVTDVQTLDDFVDERNNIRLGRVLADCNGASDNIKWFHHESASQFRFLVELTDQIRRALADPKTDTRMSCLLPSGQLCHANNASPKVTIARLLNELVVWGDSTFDNWTHLVIGPPSDRPGLTYEISVYKTGQKITRVWLGSALPAVIPED